MPHHAEYLGDGVYASFDGYQIWLRVQRDGMTHEIAIEEATFQAIVRYRQRLIAERGPSGVAGPFADPAPAPLPPDPLPGMIVAGAALALAAAPEPATTCAPAADPSPACAPEPSPSCDSTSAGFGGGSDAGGGAW